LKRYQLTFFGPDGSVEATIDLNAVSAEAACQGATKMLRDTPYSFVEVWEGGNLLLLLGQEEEPVSRQGRAHAQAGSARQTHSES